MQPLALCAIIAPAHRPGGYGKPPYWFYLWHEEGEDPVEEFPAEDNATERRRRLIFQIMLAIMILVTPCYCLGIAALLLGPQLVR